MFPNPSLIDDDGQLEGSTPVGPSLPPVEPPPPSTAGEWVALAASVLLVLGGVFVCAAVSF